MTRRPEKKREPAQPTALRILLFNDIPDSVLDEVRLGIQHYFAPLLVLSPEHPKHPVDLAGSGTLVELAGIHYILTADHVWNATEDWDEIGLVVAAEVHPSRSRAIIFCRNDCT